MESRKSMMKTPEQRKSYRRSYRSIATLDTRAHLGYAPGHIRLRASTSRRASRPRRDVAEKVDPDQLALLLRREWQLSYVTPLYGFRHTLLKAYARQLAAFIVAEGQQGLAVEVGRDSSFKVSFSVVPGLAETGDDAETVFIQIHSRPPFAGPDAPPRLAWSGWLTCVGANRECLRSLHASFVCLPLLCSAGPQAHTALVTAWFRRTFDCSFGPLEINASRLQLLASLAVDCHGRAGVQRLKQLKLVWTLPVQPPLEVAYAVHGEDAWALWRSVREGGGGQQEGGGAQEEGGGGGRPGEEESCVGIEEVKRFMKGLEGHFYRHFKVDLSAGRLKEVSTALGSAKHHGRIKISNSDHLMATLTVLTECALLKMSV